MTENGKKISNGLNSSQGSPSTQRSKENSDVKKEEPVVLGGIVVDDNEDSFDVLLEMAGGIGLWQVLIILATSWSSFVAAVDTFSLIYKVDEPDHWCNPPENFSHLTPEQYSPCVTKDGNSTSCKLDRCQTFLPDASGIGLQNVSLTACASWSYDKSVYQSTIVTEWDLVCAWSPLRSAAVSVYMLSGLVGALLFGPLGDRYGRARMGNISTVMFLICGPLVAASTSLTMFLVTTAFTAMAHVGMYACLFTLCMETVGARWRSSAGVVWVVPWALGIMAVPLGAWLLRHWWQVQLAVAATVLPMLLNLWLLPESPRWLALKGRYREAAQVLEQAARINRRQLPSEQTLVAYLRQVAHHPSQAQNSGWDPLREAKMLFGSKQMLIRSVATIWLWLAMAMVYYGVSFDAAQLASDSYIAMFLAGVVELPGLLAIPLMDRYGRRTIMAASFLLGAAAILLIPAVPKGGWPILLLGLLGKFSMGTGFAVIYVYLEEYIPTSVRNAALGLSTMAEGVGGAASPYVAYALGAVHWAAPSVLFGLAAVSAGLVTLFVLPETLGHPLPETVDDVEQYQQRRQHHRHHLTSISQQEDAESQQKPRAAAPA